MRMIDRRFLETPFADPTADDVNGAGGAASPAADDRGAPGVKAYLSLLRDRKLTQIDEVWSSDITSVPLRHGFMYLTAVSDGYSRYVLSWRLSNTRDGEFGLEALDEALLRGRPEIFNTDQGSQFASREYTGRREGAGIAVSRDGRRHVLDNVLVERLWRSVKYEDIYFKDYERVLDLESGLTAYFRSYDEDRPHPSLDDRTPGEVYRAGLRGRLSGGGP
jgi:putative transposase